MNQEMLFLPHNVPSSKNSRMRTKSGLFIASKRTREWRDIVYPIIKANRRWFEEKVKNKELPIKLGMHFVRKDKRKFDYVNPSQTILDALVHCGIFEDDNCDIICPYFFKIGYKYYSVDKEKSGVYLIID